METSFSILEKQPVPQPQSAYRARFFFLGITPPAEVGRAPANHSPFLFVDESALLTGVRALSHLAVDYLESRSAK